ncbi:MAG: hypothetical protein WCO71_13620, partial [Pseudomonadota bacterium]
MSLVSFITRTSSKALPVNSEYGNIQRLVLNSITEYFGYYRKSSPTKEDHMRQLAIFVTSALLTAGTASTALAFFDGEVSVGQRTGTWASGDSSKSLKSSSVQMAGHLDPIPLVPVPITYLIYCPGPSPFSMARCRSDNAQEPG